MRIMADAGGMDSVNFDGINQEVTSAISAFAGPLSSASGAAGDGALSSAIDDLCGNLKASDSSAAITLTKLSQAVAKAAAHYTTTDSNIAQAAR